MLSIGSLIREKVEASGMTVKEFSERIGVLRPNVYRIFSSNSIDSQLLMKICVVLNYDFFEIYAHHLEESLKGKSQS